MIAHQSIHMRQFPLSQFGPVSNIYTNMVSWFLFGEELVFMDSQNYEQSEIVKGTIGIAEKFLTENMEVPCIPFCLDDLYEEFFGVARSPG